MKLLNFLNFINGISNFPVIPLIASCMEHGDYLTAWIVTNAGLASMISHFAENHKHNLPGILNLTPRHSYVLNRIDVFWAIVTATRFLYILYSNHGLTLVQERPVFSTLLVVSLLLNIISERIPFVANNPVLFTIVHSAWHVSIFTLLRYFVNF
jgi:hypothetical protein